jgi:2-amino-4-hydroxy-6-hydroxymethyldihydropteridine diphosphokinase
VTRAVWSIGSNLGDRLAHLRAAVAGIGAAAGVTVVARSGVYETAPWGPVAQQDFLNAVVISEQDLAPAVLLDLGQALEQAAQRERRQRWGPRTLDVDLVAVGDEVVATERLTLPHPRAAERAFVLVPWLDADAEAVLPGCGPVRELVAALPAAELDGVRRTDLVLEPAA